MQLSFLGATGTVTGSRYLIAAGAHRVLVDCGLFQGLKQLRLRNREPFPVEPATLDAVVLTHAHLDHAGYLPLLIRNGFRGPVYCTSGTADLCSLLLPDSGHLQEEEAAYANRHGLSKHRPAEPLYTQQDAERSLSSLDAVAFGSEVALGDGLSFVFHRAGHIVGSSMVHLRHAAGSILFSGDLGRPIDPLLHPPADPPVADHVVLESTYGDRLHPRGDPADRLENVVVRTASRGGSVVIPSFAVGRAQTILHLLLRLRSAGRIPPIPIFLDSPMAARATSALRAHAAELRLTPAELEALSREVETAESPEDSRRLTRMRTPRIIVSASGMAVGGRVLHHLKELAPDPRNTVLFVGFQAAGTRGDAMVSGARSVKIHGGYVPVRAEVAVLDSLSAHADHAEILDWLRRVPSPPARIFLTHGEPRAADALRLRIEESLGWSCVVPDYLGTVHLERGVRAAEAARSAPAGSAAER
jgi:metallo-beta-lactamase family protein